LNRLETCQTFETDDQGKAVVTTQYFLYHGTGMRVRTDTAVEIEGVMTTANTTSYLPDHNK